MVPRLEVHRAVGQVVLAADVADLLGLHCFQLGAVSDAMAQAATEGAAPLACNGRDEVRGSCAMPGKRSPHPRSRGAMPVSLHATAAPGLPTWPGNDSPEAALAGRSNGTCLQCRSPSSPVGGPWAVPGSLTSNVQHGLIPTVQHLEHRWHLLLCLQEQGLQVHQHRLIWEQRHGFRCSPSRGGGHCPMPPSPLLGPTRLIPACVGSPPLPRQKQLHRPAASYNRSPQPHAVSYRRPC